MHTWVVLGTRYGGAYGRRKDNYATKLSLSIVIIIGRGAGGGFVTAHCSLSIVIIIGRGAGGGFVTAHCNLFSDFK